MVASGHAQVAPLTSKTIIASGIGRVIERGNVPSGRLEAVRRSGGSAYIALRRPAGKMMELAAAPTAPNKPRCGLHVI